MAFPSSVVVYPPLYPNREPTMKELDAYVKALKAATNEIHPQVR